MSETNEIATVTVTVPGLLTRFTDGRSVPLQAATVGESLDRLVEVHPALEPHLFAGDGSLRPHLTVFHDGAGVAWPHGRSIELEDGDEVTVVQAVSGG